MKTLKKYLKLALLTLLCIVVIDNVKRIQDEKEWKQKETAEKNEQSGTDSDLDNQPSYYVTLLALGQNLMNDSTIQSGLLEDGSYNFDFLFEGVSPYLKAADISVLCQGSVIGGNELGVSGYPNFNAPEEICDAAINAGIHAVAMANVRINSMGSQAITNCLNIWREKSQDMKVLGIHESEGDTALSVIERNGLRIALLDYTAIINQALTDEEAYKVSFLGDYSNGSANLEKLSEQTLAEIGMAQDRADFVVVFVNWGLENTYEITAAQTRFAKLLTENGVDLIIGNRPNYMQKVEWITSDNGNRALCFYSLGNFGSSEKTTGGVIGGMAKVGITMKDNIVCIDEANSGIIPVVNQYTYSGSGEVVQVQGAVPFSVYTDEMAAQHGIGTKYGVTFNRSVIQGIIDAQIGAEFLLPY